MAAHPLYAVDITDIFDEAIAFVFTEKITVVASLLEHWNDLAIGGIRL
jgi:hypothetical protein